MSTATIANPFKCIDHDSTLPGYEGITRFWDASRRVMIARILPGEVYISRQHELISTLLGSCVAVCMWDTVNGIGGMNHFMLPSAGNDSLKREDANYGTYAMDMLINGIMKNGGRREFLQCKIYGGGAVITTIKPNVGNKNIEFVREYLAKENIPIISEDIGNRSAQQIYFHPLHAEAYSVTHDVSELPKTRMAEKSYLNKIKTEIEKPGIEFF